MADVEGWFGRVRRQAAGKQWSSTSSQAGRSCPTGPGAIRRRSCRGRPAAVGPAQRKRPAHDESRHAAQGQIADRPRQGRARPGAECRTRSSPALDNVAHRPLRALRPDRRLHLHDVGLRWRLLELHPGLRRTIGSFFDDVMKLVEGGDEVRPTEAHVEEFIDWVHARDLFQAPDFPTDLFALNDAARGAPPGKAHALRTLPRELILQLRANPNLSLGGGYRAYPGVTSAPDPPEDGDGLVSGVFNRQRPPGQHPARLQSRPRAPSPPRGRRPRLGPRVSGRGGPRAAAPTFPRSRPVGSVEPAARSQQAGRVLQRRPDLWRARALGAPANSLATFPTDSSRAWRSAR